MPFVTNLISKFFAKSFSTIQFTKSKVSGYKKAIVTLKKGQSIDLTTGI